MWGWLDSTIIAALIAGTISILLAGWSFFIAQRLSQRQEKRDAIEDARKLEYDNMAHQHLGWESLVTNLGRDAEKARSRIRALEAENVETRRLMADCETKCTALRRRVAELERRLGLEPRTGEPV